MSLGEQVIIRRKITHIKANMCEILGGVSFLYLDAWLWREEVESQYSRLDKMRVW